jgi:hypothetical protein
MFYSTPPKKDLRKVYLPQGDWSDPRKALAAVRTYCLEQAKDAEHWYMRERQSKRIWGRFLRFLGILLVGAGVLIPILSQIYAEDGKPEIPPIWASVALLLAALLVALDKFFGFSTAWTRFIATNHEITRQRHQFEFEWQILEAEGGGTGADSVAFLDLASEFVLAIDEAVAGETLAWSAEFKASLDAAADELKSAA